MITSCGRNLLRYGVFRSRCGPRIGGSELEWGRNFLRYALSGQDSGACINGCVGVAVIGSIVCVGR